MKNKSKKHIFSIVKKSPFELSLIVLMMAVLTYTVIPGEAQADNEVDIDLIDRATELRVKALQNEFVPFGTLPESDLRGPSYTMSLTATAYNSVPEQTDDTPFTTASGTTTRRGVIAANFLPIGTRIKIPELYGDEVFIVEDRMNSRYWYRIDIWMEEVPDAIAFGAQYIEIEVYPNS
ncbi:MAG: hypothetical protein Q8P30_00555 [Candidatus Uhrbacteria bacterium]|nr:hypothetical protein [Candidatus Uhrbacteria bacterium]